MQLSDRLEKLMELAGRGVCAADIGTDHAFVPAELVRRGAFSRAVASDVRKGPLKSAEAHIRQAGLSEKIELRLGDGLSVLSPGEADVILMSGMGGALMKRLLREGEAAAKAAERLILSPQSEIPAFRSFLQENGFAITQEAAVFEDGKFYFFMAAQPGRQEAWTGADRLYGKYLLEEGGEVIRAYLAKRKTLLEGILSDLQKAEGARTQARRREAEEELRLTEEALDGMAERPSGPGE